MRKSEKLVSDIKEIEGILNKASVLRVAFANDGKPYIVPVNFGYKPGYLYFHTGYEGQKIDFLKANPEVCFEVDVDAKIVPAEHPCMFSCNYLSVVGYGTARFVEDLEEKTRALDIIMAHYSDKKFEFDREILKITVIVEIDITSMTGRRSE
jgi:uncharacterized protein